MRWGVAQTASPSMVRQYRPLASGAERLRWGGPPKAVGSPMRLHCTAAWPPSRFGGPPSFFATAGPLGPWAGGSRGPERFVRHGGRQAAPSGGPRLRLVACVSSPPALRSPVGARFGFPSPARPLLWCRWPGPGALGSWGAGGALLRCRLGPSGRLAPPGFCPPPPLSPGFAWRRLRRRCFSYRGDVAFAASRGSAVRPGRAGSLPLNGCFPCPSSFAIDAVALAGYNVPGR